MFYDIVSHYDELTPARSLYFHEQILQGARKRNDQVLEAVVMAELGFIITINGNTIEGLKMIYQSLEKAEATGNAQAIGIAYNNLGGCYPNNIKLSREYYTKALAYARSGNDYLFICFDLGNLGRLFLNDGKRDSALAYYLENYRLAVAKNLEYIIPKTLLSLGFLDTIGNSLQYYRQASLMPAAIRNKEVSNSIVSVSARYYLSKKKMDSAFYFASRFYEYAKTSNLRTIINATDLLVSYYSNLGKSDSTLKYVLSYNKLKDSLSGNNVMEQAQTLAYNDMQRKKEFIAEKAAFQNRMILYFVSAFAILLMGLAFIFWRSKRKEQQAKIVVQQQKDQLQQALDQLKSTQSQLVQSEKMASLGQLTAGIAHEIQNPLNFVNNFSEVSTELVDEMKSEIKKGNYDEVNVIADDVKQNLEKINHHGQRAAEIVKGMLQHSRSSSGVKEPTDINALADEYFRLAYHGLRAKDKTFNATMKTDFDESIGKINIIPQDIGRVVLNLITNAFYVVNEKSKQGIADYEPTVSVVTKKVNHQVEIRVTDNGNGIPANIVDKIFQPFFTTKPTGQGTGLGLSLSYDILKAHGGEITVESKEGVGSDFIIQLPIV
jgi:signal transduction histidine kinase